jgi:hypothetical protein
MVRAAYDLVVSGGPVVRIKIAVPDRLVTPEVLEAALHANTLANEQAILHGEVPHIEDAIADGVRWRPEPFTDGEHFDLAEVVTGRGWGDCDDLAPWLAGDLRASGEDPNAIARVYQSGPNRWHVVTQTSDGEILDPSRWAGMDDYKRRQKQGKIVGVGPAIARPFARQGQGGLVVMPRGGHYWARCDVPFPDSIPGHLASHARARTPDRAVEKAINGAIIVGECIGADCEQALLAGTLMCGDDDEIEDVGFLPALAMAAPAGISLAKSLFHKKKKKRPPKDAIAHRDGSVSHAIKSEKSGKPLFLSYFPQNAQGPVVMRF